jgi:2'-5' RNA ligase
VRTRRLFFGVAVDPATQSWLGEWAQGLRRQGLTATNWSAPALYHITVRFLGETPEERLARLAECAARAAEDAAPFALRFSELGAFARSRVLWLGLEDDAGLAGLQALYRRLEQALADAGLAKPETRPYRPHLTLARGFHAADLRRLAPRARRLPPGAPVVRVAELVLFESVREAGRLRYPKIGTWPLGKTGA